LGVALLVGNAAARAGSTDDDAVASALRQAVASAQQSFSSPSAMAEARTLKIGDNPPAAAHLVAGPSAADMAALDLAGRRQLAHHFAGTALTERLRAHTAMIAEESSHSSPGFTPLGGGVSDMRVESLSVDGDSATVHAIVTTWARMSQVRPDGTVVVSQPSHDLVVDASMVRTSEGWKVSGYDWTFASGSEP
jgi:hypothetical protein